MTVLRFRDDGADLDAFADEFLVVCPRCARCARVARTWNAPHRHWRPATMTCTGCGLAERAETAVGCGWCVLRSGTDWRGPAILEARCRCGTCGVWLETRRRVRTRPPAWIDLECARCEKPTRTSYTLYTASPAHAAVDRCFGLPLWLQTPLGAHTVWAYNPRHLARLRDIVTATLRHKAPGNRTLLSRLPVWLKGANRAPALRALARLERKLIA